MFVITPTSGSQIAASSAIWPNPRIAISSTSTSVPARRGEDLQRQPDLGVEVRAGWPRRARCGAISAAISSLVDVLPTEPVTRDHGGAELAPPRRAPARRSAASGSSAASTAPPRQPAPRARARRARPRRPPPARRRRTAPPSTRSPDEADEQVARPDRARVDRPRAPARRRRRAHELARRPRRRPARRPRRSRRDTAASASRATATSSNGSLRPPANSWPCSWPLPAITTTSPGCGERDRAADRRAPVDVALDVRAPPGTPARISSMIASGSSERGLSEVTSADVGQPRARSRPSAGACRGRGRRPRRTRRSRGPSASSRAASSTFSSASGLCA